MDQNQEKIKSLRGMARVYFSLPEGKGTVEAIAVVQKPRSLRLETGNFFGFPLTAFTLRQNAFEYYVIPEEKVYVGSLKDVSFNHIFPFSIDIQDLMNIFLFSKKSLKHPKTYKLHFMRIEQRGNLYYPLEMRMTDASLNHFIHWTWQEVELNPKALSKEVFELKKPKHARVVPLPTQKTVPMIFTEEGAQEP